MKSLHSLIPNLLSKPDTENADNKLYGVEAWQGLFAGLQAVNKIEDLEEFMIFGWLGSAPQRKAVRDKKLALLQAMEAVALAAA